MNILQFCSRIERFKSAICLTPRPGLAIVTPTVLTPPEPTDALELHEPVLAAESRFLVEALKRLHAASVRLEARKPTPLPEEPLERPVNPDQCRILTPPVKLANPLIALADLGQCTALVIQTDTPTGFLVAVDPFLQRTVVQQALQFKELREVPMRVRVQLGLVGIRNHRSSLTE